MAYTLQPKTTQFRSGKNILASEHVQYIQGGATLDGKKFPKGVIEVGTLIARSETSGKYEPFSTTTGFANFAILNEDHEHDGATDAVTGAVIIEGSVYEAKLPVTVTDEFKKANPNIHYVNHK